MALREIDTNLKSVPDDPTSTQAVRLTDGTDFVTTTGGAVDVNIKSGIDVEVNLTSANDSILVYGYDGVDNQKIKTNVAGELTTNVASSALPTGAATETKQDTGNTSLASIDGSIDVALSTRALESGGNLDDIKTNTDNLDVALSTRASEATLSSINSKDFATQTTLALIKAKTDNLDTTLSSRATEATLTSVKTDLDTLSGTVSAGKVNTTAAQSGTWNINDISGTVSLPTGAATATKQDTGNASLASIDGKDFATQTTLALIKAKTDNLDVALSTRATTAKQDTGNTSLASIDGKLNSLGQKAMSASAPVVLASDQSSIPITQVGAVSSGNSSTATLGISGVFTGSYVDVKDYAMITVTVFADQNSATNGLAFQWSSDGTNTDRTESSSVLASTGRSFAITVRARYFRVVYTNGTVAQAAFRLGTVLHPVGEGTITKPLDASVTDENFAQLVQAPIMARLEDSTTFSNIDCIDNLGKKYLAVSTVQKIVVAPDNQTTTNLAASATYTGTADSVLGADTVQVYCKSDRSILIKVQQSLDGTNWDLEDSYTVAANTGDGRPIQVIGQYFRVLATNQGASTTTFLRLQCYLTPISAVLPKSLTLAGNLRTAESETIQNYYALRDQKFSIDLELNLPTSGTETNIILFRNPSGSAKTVFLDRLHIACLTLTRRITYRIYKSPTVTGVGTALTISNDSVPTSSAASVLAYSSPTTSASGTKIRNFCTGVDSNSLVIDFRFGITMDANSDLLITGTPTANNVVSGTDLTWVEVPA